MAFVHGKDADLEIQDSGSTYRLFSNYISGANLSREVDTAEVTNLASGAKEYIAGLADGTISVEGFFDSVVDGYITGIIGTTKGAYYYPEGKSTGKARKACSVIVTSYETDAAVDGAVAISLELQVTGPITDGTTP